MNIKRRYILKGSAVAGAAGIAASAGLLVPSRVLGAWPEAAFNAKSPDDAIKAMLGGGNAAPSTDIRIKAPDIAENGAVVPITVSSSIAAAESITVITEKNANPMTASFELGPGAEAYVSTRIKMGKTSRVIAVVKAGGKLHSAGKEIKVTIGGCGG